MAMSTGVHVWMRHESRPTERRAPVTPEEARRLVDHGFTVTVEDSPNRVFPTSAYAAAGCAVVPAGSWPDAPEDCYVVGLKELDEEPAALRHRHVYFGHAFKGQEGARRLLSRFVAGHGTLLDIEYLVDNQGRRLAAFGYWAGYIGAALAVLRADGALTAPLRATSKEALDAALRSTTARPRVLVIGALGRCGQGARDALAQAGITPTCWDVEETRVIDRAALLAHDVLVNTVAVAAPVEPFVTPADVTDPSRRLSIICDVTCDVASACNTLPIYDTTTTWDEPVRRLDDGPTPLDLVAIDNLPSLLPREASAAFSAELTEQLLKLADGAAEPWRRCERVFHEAVDSLDLVEGVHGNV